MQADAVIAMYDISQPNTVERLGVYWIPLINQHSQCPILVVGSKADLKTTSTSMAEYEETLLPVMREYKQVELLAECSAKSFLNITDLVYTVQRVVLHPTPPLYDIQTR